MLCAGVDLGKRSSYVPVMDDGGAILRQGKVEAEPVPLRGMLETSGLACRWKWSSRSSTVTNIGLFVDCRRGVELEPAEPVRHSALQARQAPRRVIH